MSELSVILIDQKKKPRSIKINHSLEAFEEIVNGPVELLKFHREPYRLVCHVKEGYDLYYNKKTPSGTFFVVKYQNGFESLNELEVDELKKVLRIKMKKWK